MDDRAVSEVVGYTIIIGMMILSISAITVIGASTLTDHQEREQINNAEKAFDILAENIDDHANDRAEGRATEIRVSDVDLYLGSEEEFNISIDGLEEDPPIEGDPIVYETDQDSKLVYSNGALFRESDQYSHMIREPNFTVNESRTILPHIEIRGDDHISISGSETVHVRTETRSPELYQYTNGDYDGEIKITTRAPRAEAWKEYLESFDDLAGNCDIPDPSGNEATLICEFESLEEIHVPVTNLNGELS